MSESYQSAVFLLRQIDELPPDVIHPTYIDFPTIIGDRCWSDGEFALIEAAHDLFNGGGGCTLRKLIANLDDERFAALVASLYLRRPGAFTTNLIGAS